jgi:hypothetical protein
LPEFDYLTLVFDAFLEPVVPSGFNITEEIFTMSNITVTFKWNAPQGIGPEVVVDHYIISIISAQQFADSDVSEFLVWNATLSYNTVYMVNITAVNCVGESEPYLIPLLRYCKPIISRRCMCVILFLC